MFTLTIGYAYLLLTCPFILMWALLFFCNKSFRKEQISMSLWFALAGTLSEILYFYDYWNPRSVFSIEILHHTVMLEDLVFGFTFGGMLATVSFLFLKKNKGPAQYKTKLLILSSVTWFLLAIGGTMSGLNSILSTSLASVVASFILLVPKHKLYKGSILVGILSVLIMAVGYESLLLLISNEEKILSEGWYIHGTRLDIRIMGIPITEAIWFFTTGLYVFPFVAYVTGSKKKIVNYV